MVVNYVIFGLVNMNKYYLTAQEISYKHKKNLEKNQYIFRNEIHKKEIAHSFLGFFDFYTSSIRKTFQWIKTITREIEENILQQNPLFYYASLLWTLLHHGAFSNEDYFFMIWVYGKCYNISEEQTIISEIHNRVKIMRSHWLDENSILQLKSILKSIKYDDELKKHYYRILRTWKNFTLQTWLHNKHMKWIGIRYYYDWKNYYLPHWIDIDDFDIRYSSRRVTTLL
jgi:hypothetical protein